MHTGLLWFLTEFRICLYFCIKLLETQNPVAQRCAYKKGCIHLTIKASKTDPFRESANLLIAPTHHSICPIRALKRYLAKSPFHSGPLYKHKNGKCLTCKKVSRLIKKAVRKNGINPKQYLSHSFNSCSSWHRRFHDQVTWTLAK